MQTDLWTVRESEWVGRSAFVDIHTTGPGKRVVPRLRELPSAVRGSQEAVFTHPSYHSFAQPCRRTINSATEAAVQAGRRKRGLELRTEGKEGRKEERPPHSLTRIEQGTGGKRLFSGGFAPCFRTGLDR